MAHLFFYARNASDGVERLVISPLLKDNGKHRADLHIVADRYRLIRSFRFVVHSNGAWAMKHWPVLMQLYAGDDDEKAYWDSVWRDAEAKKLSGNCLCGAGDWEVAKQWYTEAEQLLQRLPSAVTMTMGATAKTGQLRHDVLCNRAQCNIKLTLWKSAVDDATSCISLRDAESRLRVDTQVQKHCFAAQSQAHIFVSIHSQWAMLDMHLDFGMNRSVVPAP